jgi:16S rRNA (cytosine967-C5)-methyltransferase
VLDALAAVLRRRIPLDDALDRALEAAGEMAARDRGFARLLLATTLRRLGQIDDLLTRMLDRPDPPRVEVTDLLRVGAAQILFLGTPAHAAVDTTVALAGLRRQPQAKGLANAVLRRIAREGEAIVATQDAGRLNTPGWLWLSWRHSFGNPTARAITGVHLSEAPLDLTVASDAQGWAARLGADPLPPPSAPGQNL